MNSSKNQKTKIRTAEKPRRILVPVDFSQSSMRAVAAAVALAKRFDARLAVIHVTPPKGSPGGHGAFELTGMTTDPRLPAREKLAEFAGKEIPEEIELTQLVKSGAAFQRIAEAAAGWEADLILIATHGQGALTHALLGSTAERVVRHATCPVLVVRARGKAGSNFHPGPRRTVLLTTDFSENSLTAFPHAVAWAREFGAKLVLIYVVPEHLPAELSQISIVFHEKRVAEEARKQLPEFARSHFPADLAVETLVLIGSPAHAICETARKSNASLIVLGSHGHTGVKHLLVGSVAERVVQHAPCAVLVVREKVSL